MATNRGEAAHERASGGAEAAVDGAMKRVLITGAAGAIGRQLVAALAADSERVDLVVATDLHPTRPVGLPEKVVYAPLDIRDPALSDLVASHAIDTVVHLAAVVTPRPGQDRATLEDIEVGGTRNVVDACLSHGVGRLVYTSSGAAYGYSADNAALIDEDDPLRGNESFAYAWHKRRIEELLETVRADQPQLAQVVFRVSTILGETLHNQITALFESKVVIGIRDVDTPFCFIWDEDVVGALDAAIHGGPPGIYNLTGDGVMTLREIAAAMGRPFVGLPEGWLVRGLTALESLERLPWGPEQVIFLRYRPVLANRRLVDEFGFRPRKSSREAFEIYRASRHDGVTSAPAGRITARIGAAGALAGRAAGHVAERFTRGGR